MSFSRLLPLFFITLIGFSTVSHADTYRLAVAPLLSPEETTQRYTALLNYLQAKTGHRFELVTSRNFMSYWQLVRGNEGTDFVLDGSHLASYRVDRRGHRFVVAVDGVVSYSLISRADDLILDPEELLGRKVAILPSPNLSGLLVNRIFDNPVRKPREVPVTNAEAAIEAVRNGEADAAFVPTPLLQRYPEATVILSTEQMPGMTLTAAESVPAEVVSQVSDALLQAASDPRGQKALEALRFVGFIVPNAADYQGLGQMMKGMWGY